MQYLVNSESISNTNPIDESLFTTIYGKCFTDSNNSSLLGVSATVKQCFNISLGKEISSYWKKGNDSKFVLVLLFSDNRFFRCDPDIKIVLYRSLLLII